MKTITVTRRGAETAGSPDSQGNLPRLPDTSFDIVVRACAPTPATEDTPVVGTTVITGYRIFGFKDLTPLLPTDRFTINGVPGWQMEGEFGLWESAFGTSRGGTEFTVRRSS